MTGKPPRELKLRAFPGPSRQGPRRGEPCTPWGMVLVVVLVVLSLLALGVYRFVDRMVLEARATRHMAQVAQARCDAASALHWAATLLDHRLDDPNAPLDLQDNPELFQAQQLWENTSAPANQGGTFWLLAPGAVDQDAVAAPVRYGLLNESGKLNLNALMQWDISEEERREVLLLLPGMTTDVADAILDWMDSDQQPRSFGAEDEYYGTLDPPYRARNGPLESLEELLLVRGVTPELLWGEDANRNGMLDPNENDGSASPPEDDADGVLDLGWAAYLTLWSRESNRSRDGQPRIYLNTNNLAQLYDQLAQEFDPTVARFVVAYRLFGPAGQGGAVSQGRPSSPRSNASAAAQSGGSSNLQAGSSGQTRAGLDLSQPPRQTISSVFDLIGVEVQAVINSVPTNLESPWPDDPQQLQEVLPQLLDRLTVHQGPYIEGRVNVWLAPREVLLAVPGMDEQLAEQILAARSTLDPNDPSLQFHTLAWLYLNEVATLDQLRSLDRYLTSGGDVYRVQAVAGFWPGPMVRWEALLDASQGPTRVVRLWDLSPLGRGELWEHLWAEAPTGKPEALATE